MASLEYDKSTHLRGAPCLAFGDEFLFRLEAAIAHVLVGHAPVLQSLILAEHEKLHSELIGSTPRLVLATCKAIGVDDVRENLVVVSRLRVGDGSVPSFLGDYPVKTVQLREVRQGMSVRTGYLREQKQTARKAS